MKLANILLIAGGLVMGIFYGILAHQLSSSEPIWLLDRALGLISYALLFLIIVLGEIRMLGVKVSPRLHCILGIVTCGLMLLHFISGIFDKYKWGIGLSLGDYLGFSFTTKWLAFLSLGTLSFYLLLLVTISSSSNVIKKLGIENWRLLHYGSYAAFTMVFVHSITLGTDVKTSAIRELAYPLMVFMFCIVIGLLGMRIMKKLFEDVLEVSMAVVIILMVSASVASFALHAKMTDERDSAILQELEEINITIAEIGEQNQNLGYMMSQLAVNLNQTLQKSNQIIVEINRINSSIQKIVNIQKTEETSTVTITPTTTQFEPVITSYINPPWQEEEEEDDD